MPQSLTAKRLIDAGLSRSFAHHVVSGTRQVSIPLALWLHDEQGLTVPQLAGKTKRELDVLRSMYEPKAPRTVIDRLGENA